MIDSVVLSAIQSKAFPGCVVYAESADSVIFYKAYGYHMYDSATAVARESIYDLASITKVVAATLALMKLYEDGYYELDEEIGKYIKQLGRKVSRTTFREALAHQAGLYPWIPFHQEMRKKDGSFRKRSVSNTPSEDYDFALSDSLYLFNGFYKQIKKMIRKSEVSDLKEYKYSGLFFYLVPELVSNMSGMGFEEYLRNRFYDSLSASSLVFNPLESFPKHQIVPTEIDTFFRMEPIHGKVHDEGAIMMKGVSGNAGLFGNASDLAKIASVLLNDGIFAGKRYLKPETIQLFTSAQYPANGNRRALGFDKPLLEYDSALSSVAKSASHRSFGHTGYTGPIFWVDPEKDLIFIFLTNRVYPNRLQRSIYDLNVRPTIHQLLYNMIDYQIGDE